MRLTNAAWEKLGVAADSRGVTRADLIEEWAEQDFLQQPNQLALFDPNQEVITKETRKNGVQLGRRINQASAALTNWIREGTLLRNTKSHDPEGIAWQREEGTKSYYPLL
jgi:hypothetical protein